jgi:hypothetical protein
MVIAILGDIFRGKNAAVPWTLQKHKTIITDEQNHRPGIWDFHKD